jgi:hypothetical protein
MEYLMNDNRNVLSVTAQNTKISPIYVHLEKGNAHVPPEMREGLRSLVRKARQGDEEALAEAERLVGAIYFNPMKLDESFKSINTSLELLRSDIFIYRDRLCQIGRRALRPSQKNLKKKKDFLAAIPLSARAFAAIINKTRKTFVKRGEKWVEGAFSENAAKDYLVCPNDWDVPQLTAIIFAPTLDGEGNPIEKEGFHEETGLYLHFGGVVFKPIAEASNEDVRLFESIFEECKFDSDVSKAVAYAWVLTSLISYSLPTKPFFLVTAPEMGSGKSAIIDVGHILATGQRAQAIPLPIDEEGLKKSLLSLLDAGEQFVCFDNTKGASHIESDVLCIATTQPTLSDRLLRTNTMKSVPCDTLISATGNGISIKGEMAARSLVCKLMCKDSKATQIKWTRDPLEQQCLKNRVEFFSAAINILYSGKKKPKPNFGLKFPRFEEWTDWIRNVVVEMGLPDPVTCIDAIEEDDPIQVTGKAIWELWHETTGGDGFAKTLQMVAAKNDELKGYLRERFPGKDGEYNTHTAGNWIAAHAGRVFSNIRLERAGDYKRAAAYRTIVLSKKT